MPIDLAATHNWVTEEVRSSRTIESSMRRLIERCHHCRPHSDWQRLHALDYSLLASLREWFSGVFRSEPPAATIRGLWFGLFNPCLADGTPTADIYVSGSERFSSDPHDNSWAVGPEWWPDSRYAESSVLSDIYGIAYETNALDPLQNDAEYPLCLAYGSLVVRDLLRESLPRLAEPVGAAVGFDSGDFIVLGSRYQGAASE